MTRPANTATQGREERAMSTKSAQQLEGNPIRDRLAGRIDYLLKIGRVKDPELMMSALEVLSDLADASRCLLDDLGDPDDGVQENMMRRCRDAIAKATGSAP